MNLASLLAIACMACVSDPADSCRVHSDCQRHGKAGVCAANGFCERECETHLDCPCGSFCADGCGICITNDGAGPATCFARERGLATDRVVTGACRNAAIQAEQASEQQSEPASMICNAEPAPTASCEQDEDGGVEDESEEAP